MTQAGYSMREKFKGMFTSLTCEWSTPDALFEQLDDEFHFTLDVCASPENTKCERYYDQEKDGRVQPWIGEVCWMNPPYGRQIGQWIQKAHDESLRGATVVCLLPSRTDTIWWHDYVMKADEIRFIKGRLKFGEAKSGAPFPSCVVVFR